MKIMERVKNMIRSWLEIQPAMARGLTIREPVSFETNVLRNRIWYRGDASEIEQLFKQLGEDAVGQARFWAAVPQNSEKIRKAHSGLPGVIVETLAAVVKADMGEMDFQEEHTEAIWELIARENDFPALVCQAVCDTLVTGDGAFKVSIDEEISGRPILEFWGADSVEYSRRHGRIQEIHFLSPVGDRGRMLREIYGPGYIPVSADGWGKGTATGCRGKHSGSEVGDLLR